MASFGGKVANFRDTFRLSNLDVLQWFPGHMGKGMKQMEKNLKNVDCIIEVHDARIPISGRYADFKKSLSGIKPHILVLSKIDLADTTYMAQAVDRLNKDGIHNIIKTNLKDQFHKSSMTILPLIQNLIKESDRFNRSMEADYAVMIIGIPNVGKSSLINRLRNSHLRKSKAAHVGAVAGITRSLMTRIKISENPSVYLYDTPGVLPPRITDIHCGLKLALVGCSQDHLVGPELLADYLLFWLNKNKRFEYVEKLGLQGVTDDVREVLIQIAIKIRKVKKVRDFDNYYRQIPDLHSAAEHFLRSFRSGELGLYCLDQDILSNE